MQPTDTATARIEKLVEKIIVYHKYAKPRYKPDMNWGCPNPPNHDEYLEVATYCKSLIQKNKELIGIVKDLEKTYVHHDYIGCTPPKDE